MRQIPHATDAFKTAIDLSILYFNGRISLEKYRFRLIEVIINFSPDEVRALADVFLDTPSGEG
jgi:hypothetical protein